MEVQASVPSKWTVLLYFNLIHVNFRQGSFLFGQIDTWGAFLIGIGIKAKKIYFNAVHLCWNVLEKDI